MSIPPSYDPIDPEYLDRYLVGDCTPDECEAVERWIAARRGNALLFEALKSEFNVDPAEPEPSNAHAVWARIAQHMTTAERTHEPEGQRRSGGTLRMLPVDRTPRALPSTIWHRAGRAAAAVLVIAVGSWLVAHSKPAVSPAPRVEPPAREYTTALGQRAEIRLTDGTLVVLAAGSRLIIPASYDSVARDVTLEGEGYFDAVHDERRPFTVRTARAVVRDLGTRFGVRAFESDEAVRVVVTQGLVRVTGADAPHDSGSVITHGDLARIRSTGETVILRGVDTTRYVAWTHGALVFERTPLRDALSDIARWYDVDFTIADPALERRTLTGTLRNEPLSAVLTLIAQSVDARVDRQGRVVVLHAGSTAHTP